MNARIEDNLMSADNSSPLKESVIIIFSMPTVRQILDRRTSIPKVLFVLRAATVPRSTEIRPLGFDWVNLLLQTIALIDISCRSAVYVS